MASKTHDNSLTISFYPFKQKLASLRRKFRNSDSLCQFGKYCFISYSTFWGLSPYEYDQKERRVKLTESKIKLLHWKLTLVAESLIRVAFLGSCFYDYCINYSSSNSLGSSDDTVTRVWQLGVVSFTGIFHWHTALRVQEIPSLMNSAILLYEKSHGRDNIHT